MDEKHARLDTAALHARAQARIPGGAHTYSKGDDQFPANAPRLIERGLGCTVWDSDGGEWLDYGMGLRSVLLGHAYAPVLDAVRAELGKGTNFTRPSPIEGAAAEAICRRLPGAEMVKFAKNGSDVTSAAVRLARAYTGRDLVAMCRANPFYSFNDWFIGSTVVNSGVPGAVRDLTLGFDYNDPASLERLFAEHPGRIGCVILEPVAIDPPRDGFLEKVAAIARREGAVLVFDEMICGFRYHLQGAFGLYGVVPDLATWGKALANGFSVAALTGRREIMRLGGLDHDRDRVFLLSATNGAETHALAAAIAALDEIERNRVPDHVAALGRRLRVGLDAVSARHGLGQRVRLLGYDQSPVLACTDSAGKPDFALRTLLLQEFCRQRILIPYIAISWAHRDADIDRTIEAYERHVAPVLARAIAAGDPAAQVVGPLVKPVFRRRN